MAGLKVPEKQRAALDGLSRAPVLKDPAAALARDALFFHYPHYYATTSPVSAIRVRDWKLLKYYEDNHVELYNLANDPCETKNVAAEEPAKAEELRRRLDGWLESVKAQMPAPNPSFKPGGRPVGLACIADVGIVA